MEIARMEGKRECLSLINQFLRDHCSSSSDSSSPPQTPLQLSDAIPDAGERREMKRKYHLQLRERVTANKSAAQRMEQQNIAQFYKPKYPAIFFTRSAITATAEEDEEAEEQQQQQQSSISNSNSSSLPLSPSSLSSASLSSPLIQLLDPTLLGIVCELRESSESQSSVSASTISRALLAKHQSFIANPIPCVFIFRVFSDDLCRMLIEESENYIEQALHSPHSGLLPIARPNSMNAYGLVLNAIGMRDCWTELMREVILPLANALLPAEQCRKQNNKNNKKTRSTEEQEEEEHEEQEQQQTWQFKSHHTFIIRYKSGEDINLATHIDDSVCLGKEGFEGARVYFHEIESGSGSDGSVRASYHTPHAEDGSCSHCQYQLQQQIGYGVLHVGHHIHGANSLTKGERSNVVIWCKNIERKTKKKDHVLLSD